MPKKQNKKSFFRLFVKITPILLFAAVGAYLVFGAKAATPNPPLARGCGLDVALLVDTSGSMKGEPREQAFNAMRNFVTTMKGTDTRFAIGEITAPGSTTWTTDTAVALRHIDQLGASTSELNDVSGMYEHDPRPNHPNLIIVLSDFHILIEDSNVDETKRDGTRILSLMYHPPNKPITTYGVASYVSGPNIDTGSVLTSDVITAKTDTVGGEFLGFAYQLCGVGPGGAGHGPGIGGTGNGTGVGGTGAGTNGSGQGVNPGNGTGGGSSGATATKVGEKPNSIPSPTGQGNSSEQPKLEPSPFFDGRTYAPGSDPIDKALGNLSIGGKRILHGWLYLLILFVVIGNFIAGYFLWWRRLSGEEQMRWKARLHLKHWTTSLRKTS